MLKWLKNILCSAFTAAVAYYIVMCMYYMTMFAFSQGSVMGSICAGMDILSVGSLIYLVLSL